MTNFFKISLKHVQVILKTGKSADSMLNNDKDLYLR
jgi:hypothetical protein